MQQENTEYAMDAIFMSAPGIAVASVQMEDKVNGLMDIHTNTLWSCCQ